MSVNFFCSCFTLFFIFVFCSVGLLIFMWPYNTVWSECACVGNAFTVHFAQCKQFNCRRISTCQCRIRRFVVVVVSYIDSSQRSSWKKYSYFLCICGNCSQIATRWQLSRCRNENEENCAQLSMMCVFEMLCSTCINKVWSP